MILSRKWLNEFVDVSDISDREFDEAMTLSGSKVETVTALDESLKNVVVGKILSMEKHPDSDHMWVCQIDVGQSGAGADRHRRMEYPCGGSGARGPAQVPAARRREDRKGQAPGRALQRNAVLSQGAGSHCRA